MDREIVFSKKMLIITVTEVLKDEFDHPETGWLDPVPYCYQSNSNPVQPCGHFAPKNGQKSLGRQHRQILKTWLFLRKPLQLLQFNIKLY